MRKIYSLILVLICLAWVSACTKNGYDKGLLVEDVTSFEKIGTLPLGGAGSTEICAYDPNTMQLFVANNANLPKVDVVDMARPELMQVSESIDFSELGGAITSIAIQHGLMAVAVEDFDTGMEGRVMIFKTSDLTLQADVRTGVRPGMVCFSPDGNYIAVASGGVSNLKTEKGRRGLVTVIDTYNFVSDRISVGEEYAGLADVVTRTCVAFSADSKLIYTTLLAQKGLGVVDVANKREVGVLETEDGLSVVNVLDRVDRSFLITANDRLENVLGANSFSVWNTEKDAATGLISHLNLVENRTLAGEMGESENYIPRHIAVGKVGDKQFTFVGMAREGRIFVFDISDPYNLKSVVKLDAEVTPVDMVFIEAKESPNDRSLLVVSGKEKGVITVFAPSKFLSSVEF